MSVFTVYLGLGFEHLLDLQGYDHILFLAGLCAAYSLRRWRELLVLVTAFTIGHSVSLALATLRIVDVNTSLVEFLIPVTIVATAAINLAGLRAGGVPTEHAGSRAGPGPTEHAGARAGSGPPQHAGARRARHARYAAALAFGVVHGLGFSNFLRLALGEESNIFVPLLSFNIGLELAQVLVAGAMTLLALLATRFLPVSQKGWNLALSVATGATAAWMAVQRWPF